MVWEYQVKPPLAIPACHMSDHASSADPLSIHLSANATEDAPRAWAPPLTAQAWMELLAPAPGFWLPTGPALVPAAIQGISRHRKYSSVSLSFK